jgi:hypothetical protein
MTNNPNSTNAPPDLDWTAIYVRCEFIADTLRLPYSEVEKAKASEGELIDFVRRYKQCFDWVIEGDVSAIVKRLAGRPLWPPLI